MNYDLKPEPYDPELEEAAARATKSANFLALCSVVEEIQINPGPNYRQPQMGEGLAGVLRCKVCDRLIADHAVAEFCVGRVQA